MDDLNVIQLRTILVRTLRSREMIQDLGNLKKIGTSNNIFFDIYQGKTNNKVRSGGY